MLYLRKYVILGENEDNAITLHSLLVYKLNGNGYPVQRSLLTSSMAQKFDCLINPFFAFYLFCKNLPVLVRSAELHTFECTESVQ